VILALVNVPIVDSLNSLELDAQQVLEGHLRVTVAKGISRPCNFVYVSEFFVHPVHADRVLIEDVVVVANSFVVLDPSAVDDVQLPFFDHFLHIGLLFDWNVFVPIFEKDDLGHEVFSLFVLDQGVVHRIENFL
jgi:hypothetical protein